MRTAIAALAIFAPITALAQEACDVSMFRANAIFIRATTYCPKNYVDSPAGLAALEGARGCPRLIDDKERLKSAIMELDRVMQELGKVRGCQYVDDVARFILGR